MIDLKKLEKILPLVEKPGRYIGGEVGIARKRTDVPIRFLFAFTRWGCLTLGALFCII